MKDRKLLLIAQCIILLCSVTLVSSGANKSSEPAAQEIIDLASFRSENGLSLAETIKGHSLAMIVLVNPECETCTAAKDSLRELKERLAKAGIVYFVVMLPRNNETQRYFAYANSLNLQTESFVWAAAERNPPGSLATMPVPSHLLIDREGRVVDRWVGMPEIQNN